MISIKSTKQSPRPCENQKAAIASVSKVPDRKTRESFAAKDTLERRSERRDEIVAFDTLRREESLSPEQIGGRFGIHK
ncbi:hypothetical protein NXC24_PA00279 (plasmid) [Rhizobium sp. NXC24]|nr:hypothetical protein NXC24_PA00279 [Rhizobium sp. NXC24]